MSDQKYIGVLKDVHFASEEKFDAWLKKTMKCRIDFIDNGQDCLRWWIDKGGEVLHAEPFQSRIWSGMCVDLDELKVGLGVPVIDSETLQTKRYDFIVEKISRK